MLAKLSKRMRSEGGFTLIELLIVLIIIGILVAIAVPSYLGFRDRANDKAAASNVRSAVPAVEAYFADQDPQSYAGLTIAELEKIDAGIKLTTAAPKANGAGVANMSYCISSTVSDKSWHKNGPNAVLATGVCPA